MSVLEQSPELQPEVTPTATHEDESSSNPALFAETDPQKSNYVYVPELGRYVDPFAPPHDPDERPEVVSHYSYNSNTLGRHAVYMGFALKTH